MADHSIKFNIGSTFSGEGFQKARAAIQDVNLNVRKGATAISLLASNLGMLDAKYAKATSAVTGLITAMTAGTPVLMALQVGITTITAVVGVFQKKLAKMNEEVERQKEIMKGLQESYAKAFSDKLDKQMSTVLANVANISKELKLVTDQANEFTAAMNKLSTTKDAGGILQLKIDKLLALDGKDGATAELIAAQKDLAIVLKQNASREQQAQDAIDAANKRRIDAQKQVEAANLQLAEIDAQINANAKRYNQASERNTAVLEKIAKAQEELAAKRAQIEGERDKAERAVVTAQYAVTQAEEEAKNVVAAGNLDRLNAQNAITAAEKKLAEEKEKAAEEEADWHNFLKEQRRKLDEATDFAEFQRAVEERARLEKEAAEIQTRQNQAASELEKAEREYAAALEAYNKNIVANLTNEKIQEYAASGGFGQIGSRLNLQDPAIQKAAAEAAIAAGIADGSIRTAAQAGRAGRDAERAARDYASSKQARQEAQDARRREELTKEQMDAFLKGKELDPRKQAELDRLNQLQAGKDKQKAELEAAQKAQRDAQEAATKAAKTLEDINKKIDRLTIK